MSKTKAVENQVATSSPPKQGPQYRIPYLYIATGIKGGGKTYFSTNSIMYPYIEAKGQNKPVLIFDTNSEYEGVEDIYFDITLTRADPANPKKQVPDPKKIAEHIIAFSRDVQARKFKPQMRRILPFKPNKEEMTPQEKRIAAQIILKYFKTGLVVLEDLNSYMLGAKTVDMISAIVTNRHRNQDILIHLQSVSAMDPRMFANVNVIRMHHQPDPLKRISDKLTNPELFYIAKEIVDSKWQTNPYAFVYVYPQLQKIGNVDEWEFREGCKLYLNSNPGVLRQYMQRMDLDSGKATKRSANEAVSDFVNSKMHYIQA